MLSRIFFILIFFVQHPAYALKAPGTFARRFEHARNTVTPVPPPILQGKHVVFIAGIMNELADLISNYFPDNIEAAHDMGASTSYIAPSSSFSIPENAGVLYARIQSIYEQVRRPLILVGHSKGGAEVLHLVLEHPELTQNGTIEKVLLIQPAIGGSPLASKSGLWINFVSFFLSPDLETLYPQRAKENFDRAFAYHEHTLLRLAGAKDVHSIRESISKRIFYVRGQQHSSRLSLGVEIVLGIWQASLDEEVPNDGLLPVSSQFDRRIGIDLGVLQADHIDLVVSKVSNMSKQDRKVFTYAVFEQIYAD